MTPLQALGRAVADVAYLTIERRVHDGFLSPYTRVPPRDDNDVGVRVSVRELRRFAAAVLQLAADEAEAEHRLHGTAQMAALWSAVPILRTDFAIGEVCASEFVEDWCRQLIDRRIEDWRRMVTT